MIITNSYQALEWQLSLLAYWRSEEAIEQGQYLVRQMLKANGAAPSTHDFIGMAVDTLQQAETYFITSEITTLILESLVVFPDVPLRETLPLSSIGFALLGHPIETLDGQVISAFSWHREFIQSKGREDVEVLFFCIFNNGRNGNNRIIATLTWPLDDNWGSDWSIADVSNMEASSKMIQMRGFMASFFAFSQQRIVTTVLERCPRSVCRRLKHTGVFQQEPLVRVIVLRRKEYRHNRDNKDGNIVDWSCRWIVKSHWRFQYYPSQAAHQLLWIPSYVKGPDNKPLKRSRMEIFSVSR